MTVSHSDRLRRAQKINFAGPKLQLVHMLYNLLLRLICLTRLMLHNYQNCEIIAESSPRYENRSFQPVQAPLPEIGPSSESVQ